MLSKKSLIVSYFVLCILLNVYNVVGWSNEGSGTIILAGCTSPYCDTINIGKAYKGNKITLEYSKSSIYTHGLQLEYIYISILDSSNNTIKSWVVDKDGSVSCIAPKDDMYKIYLEIHFIVLDEYGYLFIDYKYKIENANNIPGITFLHLLLVLTIAIPIVWYFTIKRGIAIKRSK